MPKNTPVSVQSSEQGPCLFELKITVPADRVTVELDKAYQGYAKGMKMPGFRPGRIPASVLRGQFGDALIDEVKGNVLQMVIAEALRETQLDAMRLPDFDADKIEMAFDEELSFSVQVESFPSITLPDWSELAIEAEDCTPEDSAINEALQQIQEGNKQFDEVDEGLSGELTAECKLVYAYEGEKTDATDGIKLNLGQALYGSEDAAYADAMTGAKAGDQIELEVEFNEGFQNAEWVGKKGTAEIEILKITKGRPATEEELVKNFGMKDQDELRKRVAEGIERENFQRDQDRRLFEALEKIHELHPFSVPATLVQEEMEGALEGQKKQLMQSGMPEEEAKAKVEASSDSAELESSSERKLRHFFALREIARVERIRVTANDLKQQFRAMAAQHGVDPKMLESYYKEQNMEEQMKSEILEAKARGHLLSLMTKHGKVAEAASAE